MKNSTLLRLFFISIGLPLTYVSSASTPSTPTPKSRPEPPSVLVDTTNTASAVPLKDQGILVQSVPKESQVSRRDEQVKRFEELISKGQYEKIAELGKDMNDEELSKCLCQVVTKLDQFIGIYWYLKGREMVPAFLAQGDMVLAKEVIIGTGLLETNGLTGQCDGIYDAIALSFKEDRHERVVGLFEAAQERPDWKDSFNLFVQGFFKRYHTAEDSMPLKRFLTLHGEELSKKHPAIFGTICEELVWKLRNRLVNPGSQKPLIDLVGQPFLLTPVAFAAGFLSRDSDTDRANFGRYGYKEAIEEGLKKKYYYGGRDLWRVMVSEFPDQFSGEYPSTGEARSRALRNFKSTKQNREEAWIKENTPILLARLDQLMPGLLLKDLWNLIFEYEPITWIVV